MRCAYFRYKPLVAGSAPAAHRAGDLNCVAYIDAYTASISAVARGSISRLGSILFIVYPNPIFASGSAEPREPPAPGWPKDFGLGPSEAPGCDIMKPSEKRVLMNRHVSGPLACSTEHCAMFFGDITRTPSSSPPRASAP